MSDDFFLHHAHKKPYTFHFISKQHSNIDPMIKFIGSKTTCQPKTQKEKKLDLNL